MRVATCRRNVDGWTHRAIVIPSQSMGFEATSEAVLMKSTITACLLALVLSLPGHVQAAVGASSSGHPETFRVPRGYQPQTARGRAVHAIVLRWSPVVQKNWGTSPARWAEAMRSTFARAPLENLQAAASARGFDAMLSALHGGTKAATKADVAPTRDLLYTMITPCRIVDTRISGQPLAAGESRSFGVGSYFDGGSQGGSRCNLPSGLSAVTLNVTAVYPDAAGFLTVYPHGASRPLASSLNYRAGDIVGNEIIARQSVDDVSSFTSPSFTVYSFARTHVVIDVSGYFTLPSPQVLDCVDVASPQVTIAAGGTARATAPACPAGYTSTGGGCTSNIYPSVAGLYYSSFGPTASSAFVCDGNSNRTTSTTFTARGRCCRVPGN